MKSKALESVVESRGMSERFLAVYRGFRSIRPAAGDMRQGRRGRWDMGTSKQIKLTAETITDEQIEDLCDEANEAGDVMMAEICNSALRGDSNHRGHCADVINSAKAMQD